LPLVAQVLTEALRREPELVLEVIGSPDVVCHLLALESGARSASECLNAAIVAILVALASAGSSGRSVLAESVLWQAPIERLIDRQRGLAFAFAPPVRALVAGPLGVDLELATGRHCALSELVDDDTKAPGVSLSRPFHSISETIPTLFLSEIDTNPLNQLEGHPDKHGNELSLGSRPVKQWTEALGSALDLIRVGLPTWFDELPLALERLIPVGFEPEQHLSASYREAPGLAYLTLHPNPVTLAEAIIHETQHGKLNLLSWLDPVLRNGLTTWTSSPVRPDLRPLMGVLLAVHAFVPVSAFHLGLHQAGHPLAQRPEFAERRRQVVAGNNHGLAVLQAQAQATVVGARLLEGLQRLHQTMSSALPSSETTPPGEAQLAAFG
jgi:HEXXH motif-containing protein